METITTILSLVRPNCYMGSIDIKDAYYGVPVCEEDQKYLKFNFDGQLFQFTCLPNGLCSGPRKFTKLLKGRLASLREIGHVISAYIDDIFNLGMTYQECQQNIADTINLLDSLGFIIHPDKSKFIPSKEVTCLGYVINSETMTVKLTADKKVKIKEACKSLTASKDHTIRYVAKVIGMLTASFPAVKYGKLHFTDLEKCKSQTVKYNNGCYDSIMQLDESALEDVNWWIGNIDQAYNDIYHGSPSSSLITDASKSGWGAIFDSTKTNGLWSISESLEHVNIQELKAILYGLIALVDQTGLHIKVQSDNTTSVSGVNKMGTSHSQDCNTIVKLIWQFAKSNNLWLPATHIPGIFNKVADTESRKHEYNLQCKLNEIYFQQIPHWFGKSPEIDLFASRINYQIKPFLSYKPDPEAFAVNAFLLNWNRWFFYAFPPFCLISRILQKVYFDKAEGIIVVPKWPNQPWYSFLSKMLVHKPIVLPPRRDLLLLPSKPQESHPLHQHLQIMTCHISGKV